MSLISERLTFWVLATVISIGLVPRRSDARPIPARDGTGTIVRQNGNRFNIRGGRLSEDDRNLFHSFEQFGLSRGQIADFISKPEIANIFARITSGNASFINGLIEVSGGRSNLFIMNPAGIIFGSGASLNLPADFSATTATGIGFRNGWFDATNSANYDRLVGEPISFVFNVPEPGAIANFGNLRVQDGNSLHFSGGTILSPGNLTASEGQIIAVSVPGQNVLRITSAGSLLELEIRPTDSMTDSSGRWSIPVLSLPELLTGSGEALNSNSSQVTSGDVLVEQASAQIATFAASQNLLLPGSQISTTGDLNLFARGTVYARDAATVPFRARSGGSLTVQGNQSVDILTLNYPNAAFQSADDITLISNGMISADARFATGGNFSVQTLSGDLGSLYSIYDPIISANGDVTFGSYNGVALKVEATGNITAGNITITGSDTTVRLSDPDAQILRQQPALILRAGLTALSNSTNTPRNAGGTNFRSTRQSSSTGSISIGNVRTSQVNANGGAVILDARGNISTGSINSSSVQDNSSGNVSISSRLGSIRIRSDINSSSENGNAGDINISSASGSIETRSLSSGTNNGNAGDIDLSSASGNITTNGNLNSSTNNGNAGDINLSSASGNITTSGRLNSSATNGNSGDINVSSASGNISTASDLNSSTNNGNAGDIDLSSASGNITTNGRLNSGASNGNSGEIDISTASGNVSVVNSLNTNNSSENQNTSTTSSEVGNISPSNPDISSDTSPSITPNQTSYRRIVIPETIEELESRREAEFEKYFGRGFERRFTGATDIRYALHTIEERTNNRSAIVYVLVQDNRLEIRMVTSEEGAIDIEVQNVRKSEFLAEVNKLHTLIQNPQNNEYLRSSQKIYNWLIRGLESYLKNQRINTLLFTMEENFRIIPLAALYDGNQFLIEKYSLGIIPNFGSIDTRYTNISNLRVLAMGASNFPERSLPPLSAVPLELFVIEEEWHGKTFLNDEFTLNNLRLGRQQQPFNILHLATHANFVPGSPGNSNIQLWNSQIDLDEAYVQLLEWNNPPIDLLILSACRTALGNREAELGFAGFAVRAGVKTTVASLWDVSDIGSLLFMKVFYESLKETPIKAEALRRTQIALTNQEQVLKHLDEIHDLAEKFLEGQAHSGLTEEQRVEINKISQSLGNEENRRKIANAMVHPFFWSSFIMIGSPW